MDIQALLKQQCFYLDELLGKTFVKTIDHEPFFALMLSAIFKTMGRKIKLKKELVDHRYR
jgi:hypothetical protein